MPNTEFLITSLVVVLIPGTGVIYTVSTGLFQGWRASIAAACGCTAGIIPHLLASSLGLAAILHMSAIAFQLLKFAGVGYLLYLAWSMWRETGALSFDAPTRGRGAGSIALRGFLINILNPKLSIFFLAFLPQFVPAGTADPLLQVGWLSAIFMVMTLIIFILYGFCAHGVRSYVVNSPILIKRLQRSFALVFAALGCKLALSDR
jgi:threonine/homoserine/homoserine lactone efflux protein